VSINQAWSLHLRLIWGRDAAKGLPYHAYERQALCGQLCFRATALQP
jgi:hypothetical protein